MKILILDDNKDARYLLQSLLQNAGYPVLEAANGKSALELLAEEEVDLIISDILMPVMDGFQFCRIVKKDIQLRKIPFVFYTATYLTEKDKQFALSLGADKYLKKPMEPENLLQTVDELMACYKKGEYHPQQPDLRSEEEVFKQYNERLIKKLEDKVLELESEIRKRRKTEEDLQKAIQEKELLLLELYHRTKNNMQVIISMLHMRSNLIDKENRLEIIKDIENKIRTMALVHQKLYESKDLSQVNLKNYFTGLVDLLIQCYFSDEQSHEIKLELEDINVLIDVAIPFGLILNELLTNAIKHAFPDNRKGVIEIKLTENEDKQLILEVNDNGIGVEPDFITNSLKNHGLNTAHGLIIHQLRGQLDFRVDNGLQMKVTIEHEHYAKRV
ncbi:MAG: response regulator [Candidatus Cloacimonetes bacterium]|nr:response regulator [Candidatus Cloacimonadota bacterium]